MIKLPINSMEFLKRNFKISRDDRFRIEFGIFLIDILEYSNTTECMKRKFRLIKKESIVSKFQFKIDIKINEKFRDSNNNHLIRYQTGELSFHLKMKC